MYKELHYKKGKVFLDGKHIDTIDDPDLECIKTQITGMLSDDFFRKEISCAVEMSPNDNFTPTMILDGLFTPIQEYYIQYNTFGLCEEGTGRLLIPSIAIKSPRYDLR